MSRIHPGTLTLERQDRRFHLKRLDAGVEEALSRLDGAPAGRDELAEVAASVHADADVDRLDLELGRLAGLSLIRYGCRVAGRELLRAAPTGALASFEFSAPPPTARWRSLTLRVPAPCR